MNWGGVQPPIPPTDNSNPEFMFSYLHAYILFLFNTATKLRLKWKALTHPCIYSPVACRARNALHR